MNRAGTILLVLILSLLIPSVLCAQPSEQAPPLYKVGLAYRTFKLDVAYNWRGAKTLGLISVIWAETTDMALSFFAVNLK